MESNAIVSRWVSWAAVSTLPQAKKISLSDQLATNRRHMERHGGTLVAELTVPGESRSIILLEDACAKMPAYAQLRDLIRGRAFDVLVCLDTTRLGRKASLALSIKELCASAGILVYETESPPTDLKLRQGIDIDLIGAIKSVMAQDEVRKFSRRREMGIEARIRRGLPPKLPPYGYRYEYAPDGTKRIIIDEQKGPGVQLFYRLYLAGWSLLAIGEELRARGLRPRRGGDWNATLLARFLDAGDYYVGVIRYVSRGEPIYAPAVWPPLIDQGTLDEARRLRASRAGQRRSVYSGKLFSGVLRCGGCGRSITVSHHEHGQQRYVCPSGCRGSYIGDRKLIAAMEGIVVALADQAVYERVLSSIPTTTDDTAERLASAQAALADTQTARQRLTNAYVRGVLLAEEYDAAMEPLATEAATLQARIAELSALAADIPDRPAVASRLASLRDEGLARLRQSDQRAVNAWMRAIRLVMTVASNRVVSATIEP